MGFYSNIYIFLCSIMASEFYELAKVYIFLRSIGNETKSGRKAPTKCAMCGHFYDLLCLTPDPADGPHLPLRIFVPWADSD